MLAEFKRQSGGAYNNHMYQPPDFNIWDTIIRQPDWYIKLKPQFMAWRQEVEYLKSRNPPEAQALKDSVQTYFEAKLGAGEVALASSGDNFDADRQPISQIIIHHTSRDPGITLGRLNAIQLLNLYVPVFYERYRGRPIWSNHVRDQVPVFWAYHWLIRADGTAERLLLDHETGWQAGNWDVNCRSVAICIDDDLTHKAPSDEVIAAVRQLIVTNYPAIKSGDIFGHNQINSHTLCPGHFSAQWLNKLS